MLSPDVKALEESIESSATMDESAKRIAKENLEAIKRDAEEFSQATSAKAKDLLRTALHKRVEALHMALGESNSDTKVASQTKSVSVRADKSSQAAKVVDDIHSMESAVASSKLPESAKQVNL